MQVQPDMALDPVLLEQHADAIEIAAGAARIYVRELQALPPEAWTERMMRHTAHVASMETSLTRHTVDMYQRFGLTESEVASLFGMREGEHQEMMDRMRRVRATAGRLQVAPRLDLREEDVRAHLADVEEMAGTLERGAERMRRAG